METFKINRIPRLLQLTGIKKRTWSILWYEARGAWRLTSKTDLKSLHSSAHQCPIAFPEVALLYPSAQATGKLIKRSLGGNEVAFSCQSRSWSCKSYPIRSCKLRRCHFRNNYKYISYSIFPFISALPHSGTIRHNVSVDLLSCTVISAAFFSRDQGKNILILYFTIWLFYLKSATVHHRVVRNYIVKKYLVKSSVFVVKHCTSGTSQSG